MSGYNLNTYVRVFARCTNEERLDDLLHFDLRLKDGRVSMRHPVYGWQLGLGESKPFVISNDGQVDFGTAYNPQRYGQTDLLDSNIALERDIRWWGHGYGETYRIRSIKSLEELI